MEELRRGGDEPCAVGFVPTDRMLLPPVDREGMRRKADSAVERESPAFVEKSSTTTRVAAAAGAASSVAARAASGHDRLARRRGPAIFA